jgi:hypothetical protein
MGIAVIAFIAAVDPVIGELGVQLVLKQFSELKLRFRDQSFIEFQIGRPFPVERKGLIARTSDHFRGEASQTFDSVFFGIHLVTSLFNRSQNIPISWRQW